jgi:hypothetical protein
MRATTCTSGFELAVDCGMPAAARSWMSDATPGKSLAPVV